MDIQFTGNQARLNALLSVTELNGSDLLLTWPSIVMMGTVMDHLAFHTQLVTQTEGGF